MSDCGPHSGSTALIALIQKPEWRQGPAQKAKTSLLSRYRLARQETDALQTHIGGA